MEFIPLKIGESDIPPAPPVYLHIILHHTALPLFFTPRLHPRADRYRLEK